MTVLNAKSVYYKQLNEQIRAEVAGGVREVLVQNVNGQRYIGDGISGTARLVLVGYAMRGGEKYIRDDVGYRVGIHMKEYMDKIPAIVVGGRAGDFLCGTGMHAGVIYIRGEVEDYKLGIEIKIVDMLPVDDEKVQHYVSEYVSYFGGDIDEILAKPFKKLIPFNRLVVIKHKTLCYNISSGMGVRLCLI